MLNLGLNFTVITFQVDVYTLKNNGIHNSFSAK